MVNIKDILDYYFPIPFERNKGYDVIENESKKDKLTHKNYEVFGYVSHYEETPKGLIIAVHSSVKTINYKSDLKLSNPFGKIDACEYMYYGFMLNMLALCAQKPISKLYMVQMPNDNSLYEFKYKPMLAIDMITAYKEAIKAEIKEKEIAPIIQSQLSLF